MLVRMRGCWRAVSIITQQRSGAPVHHLRRRTGSHYVTSRWRFPGHFGQDQSGMEHIEAGLNNNRATWLHVKVTHESRVDTTIRQ